MDFKETILKARKEKLGLDIVDTQKIFNCILNVYKEKILTAPRNILGYTIMLSMCNMNHYNKLGSFKNLYNTWEIFFS